MGADMTSKAFKFEIFSPFLLLLVAMMFPIDHADAQSNSTPCSDKSSQPPVGLGLRLVEECTVLGDPENFFDAYYRVKIDIETKEGFSQVAKFKNKSSLGDVLKQLIGALRGTKKTNFLSFGVIIKDGNIEYPTHTVITFTKNDNNEWESEINDDLQSLSHRLTSGRHLDVQIEFYLSEGNVPKVNAAPDLLRATGVEIASGLTGNIIGLTNSLSNTIIGGNRSARSLYSFKLAPGSENKQSATVRIFGIKDTEVPIAEIKFSLIATRSLFSDFKPYSQLDSTIPTGQIDNGKIDELAETFGNGDQTNWGLQRQLIAASPLTQTPLSKAPTESEISQFCSSIRSAIARSFALTETDGVLVLASLLKQVTEPVKKQMPTLKQCFDDNQLTMIEARLGIKDEYIELKDRYPTPDEMRAAVFDERQSFVRFFTEKDFRDRNDLGKRFLAKPHNFSDSNDIGVLTKQSVELDSASDWINYLRDSDKAVAKHIGCFVFPGNSNGVPEGSFFALGKYYLLSQSDRSGENNIVPNNQSNDSDLSIDAVSGNENQQLTSSSRADETEDRGNRGLGVLIPNFLRNRPTKDVLIVSKFNKLKDGEKAWISDLSILSDPSFEQISEVLKAFDGRRCPSGTGSWSPRFLQEEYRSSLRSLQ